MKKLVLFLLAISLVLSGCGVLQPPAPTTPTEPSVPNYVPGELDSDPVEVDFAVNDEQMFTGNDSKDTFSEDSSAVILLEGDKISCSAPSVIISGTTATITRGGTYIVRGELNDGMIVINAPDQKPQLVLDGAKITSDANPALYVKEAKKVFLTLAADTENELSNGGSFAAMDGRNIDGAVYCTQDLSINGKGSLKVVSPVGHGITCKDNLSVTDGKLTVQSAFHGLDVNESIRIKNGVLNIEAGKDGIHAEDTNDPAVGFVYISGGTLAVKAQGDGISAALHMQIRGGTYEITAGGGRENGKDHSSGNYGDFPGRPGVPPGGRPGVRAASDDDATSMKGLKAGKGLLVEGGKLNVNAADDALHSDTVTVINGGLLTLATGDDGIHATTDLNITAGEVNITNSYEGMEAQKILISGGKISLIATDDGLNAAGGMDASGEGGRDQMPGGQGRPGGMGGASNGTVVISGGSLYVQASGDGIDANGSLQISGGYTVVCGPDRGDTATLDFDGFGSITGGVFIGTGASGMAQTFSNNAQGVLTLKADRQTAGTKIVITDENGKEMISHTPALDFSMLIFSAPELVSGEKYHVSIGAAEGDWAAN